MVVESAGADTSSGFMAHDNREVPHVSRNSGYDEWYTPPEYIDAARQVLGTIDLDPASSDIAQQTVQATTYFTIETDGLSRPWSGKVWMNPPYGTELISEFVSKLCTHFDAGDVPEAIVLVNNATETSWFQSLAKRAAATCFPSRRIRFLRPDGDTNSPLQGQALCYLGENPTNFAEVFREFGCIFIGIHLYESARLAKLDAEQQAA
jgi:ParB family chromosome partitioning protein